VASLSATELGGGKRLPHLLKVPFATPQIQQSVDPIVLVPQGIQRMIPVVGKTKKEGIHLGGYMYAINTVWRNLL
jgi:hypothetical protein